MSRFSRWSRRSWLRGAGAGVGVALAPFVPRRAWAQDPAPKRLLLLFSANGTIHNQWRPTGTETDFTLGPILAPLEPHKDKLVIVDGVHMDRQGPGDAHQQGIGLLWNGSRMLDGPFEGASGASVGWGGGVTVDQFVAARNGGATKFASIEAGVQTKNFNVKSRMSYKAANQPVPPENNPYALFDRIFGDLDLSQSELARIRAERSSVIDLVRADLQALQGRIGAADNLKIDAHLSGIREVERRLDLSNPVGAACVQPTLGAAINHNANDNFGAVSRLMIDQLVMSLACDLTRVASLQWSHAVSFTRFNWLGAPGEHHEISHAPDSDQTAQNQLIAINTWYAEEVKYLLDGLAAVPEGDGTLLDNTLVVWGNELGKGNSHSDGPIPFVLAGGAGGGLQTGRSLSFDSEKHNRLLVSICRAMGHDDVQTFGDIDDGSGPLAGL